MFCALEMKLVLSKLCLFLVIVANVQIFARIWENVDRAKLEIMRSTRFVPKVAKKLCLLKPQKGPCRANIEMYHFNPSYLNCSVFEWGGCQGNGNRFNTENDCLDYCKTKRSNKMPYPYWCQLTFDYGYCFGAVKRYYYDKIYKVCKETIYSGCGGNKNNFYSMGQCQSVCVHGLGFTTKKADRRDQKYKTVVIVDPENTTPHRGRDQASMSNHTVGTFIRKVVNDTGVFYVTVYG